MIDTITQTEQFSDYHVLMTNSQKSIEGDLDFEFQPTNRGILDTIKAAGLNEIREIVAPVSDIELYNDRSRWCLLAFKDSATRYISCLCF